MAVGPHVSSLKIKNKEENIFLWRATIFFHKLEYLIFTKYLI
jgi:hypothetical protein